MEAPRTPQRLAQTRAAGEGLGRSLERGHADGYWQHNLVEGRAEALRLLLQWMQPLEHRRVFDAGCGLGTIARRLTELGATVTACDHDAEVLDSARRSAPAARIEHRDLVDVLRDSPPESGNALFDDVLLWEVIESIGPARLPALCASLDGSGAKRVFVVVRLESRWHRFGPTQGVVPELPTAEPTQLLRRLHLGSRYRLRRQRTVSQRNSVLQVMELSPETRAV